MTNKDLLAVTGTCMRLYDTRALFEVKPRFPHIKIPQPLFGIPLDRKGTQLLLAANAPPWDPIYATPYTQQLEDKFYFYFKARCMELNVYSNNCTSFIYATAAIENLNTTRISLNIFTYDMEIKLKSGTVNFIARFSMMFSRLTPTS